MNKDIINSLNNIDFKDSVMVYKTVVNLLEENQEYKEVIDKAIEKLQMLIDIGLDYDGFNQIDSLKTLIDEIVIYAKETRNILKEVE